jgi:diacylglycerol kinase
LHQGSNSSQIASIKSENRVTVGAAEVLDREIGRLIHGRICTIPMRYWIKRLSHPFRGLRYAFIHDDAIRIETVLAVTGLPTVYFQFHLSATKLLLLIFCWFFVMVTELQNSAIEIALTKVHPEHNEEIGRSKDLAAAAVVWAAIFGLVCLAYVIVWN